MVWKDNDGKVRCRTILSKIVSLYAEQNDLQYAVPGGLIGEFAQFLYQPFVCVCTVVLLAASRVFLLVWVICFVPPCTP